MDALAHQPYAPTPGKGIYALTLSNDLKLSLTETTEALNPAVLIPHSDQKSIYAIVETIQENGTVLRYDVTSNGSIELQDSFVASGKSTC